MSEHKLTSADGLAGTPILSRSVVLVLLTRLVPVLAAPITLFLVASKRPIAEQGLYFIFWNVQALSQLMELSIGSLIVQFASHESEALSWDSRGGLTGDPMARRRVSGILREGFKWYGRVSILLLLVGGAGGAWLLESRGGQTSTAPWLPWLVTIGFTSAYLPLVPLICVAEGCAGGLFRVQRMRLVQVILSIAAVWTVLPIWGALWAVAAASALWLAVVVLWLVRGHSGLLTVAREGVGIAEPSRFAAAQWRTGASALAAWIAPQAVTPIVLATQGPVAAGKIGMTLAIAAGPLTLATAWLAARYPRYGALVARGADHELQRVARSAALQALCALAMGIAAAMAAVFLIGLVAPALAARALPPIGVGILGTANLCWLLMQALGSYLRAWREEPLMEVTIAGTALVSVGTLLAALRFAPLGVVAAYALLVSGVALPISVFGFHRHHRARHA